MADFFHSSELSFKKETRRPYHNRHKQSLFSFLFLSFRPPGLQGRPSPFSQGFEAFAGQDPTPKRLSPKLPAPVYEKEGWKHSAKDHPSRDGRPATLPVLNLPYLSLTQKWGPNDSSRAFYKHTPRQLSFILSSSSRLKQKCIFSGKALTAKLTFSR